MTITLVFTGLIIFAAIGFVFGWRLRGDLQ